MKKFLSIFLLSLSLVCLLSLSLFSLSSFAASVNEFPYQTEGTIGGGTVNYDLVLDTEKQYQIDFTGVFIHSPNGVYPRLHGASASSLVSLLLSYDTENSVWVAETLSSAVYREAGGIAAVVVPVGYEMTVAPQITASYSGPYGSGTPFSLSVSEYTPPSPLSSALSITNDIADVGIATGDKFISFIMENPVALVGLGAFLVVLFVSFISRFFKN